MSKTKLGPHLLAGSNAAKQLAANGAPLVVMVDTFDPTYAGYSGLTIIGRRVSTYDDDPQHRVVTAENLAQAHSPTDAAQLWVNIQRSTYQANPWIKIWLGPNEPGFTDDLALMQWYGLFEAARVKFLAEQLGLRAAVGAFSYGTPDVREGHLDCWRAFLPALKAAASNGGILALHEYNDGPLTGNLDAQGEGWLTFRYRKVKRLVLDPNGLGQLPIALTEFGAFDWKRHQSAQQYAEDLHRADLEILKDPTLLGAAIFTCGHNNPAWDSYDIEGSQIPVLLAQMSSTNQSPTPATTPVPQPSGDMPVTQPTTQLINPDLLSAGFHKLDDKHVNTLVPNGWNFQALDGPMPRVPGQDPKSPWLVPDAAAGPGYYKIARPYGIQWWVLWQTIDNLAAGKYELTTQIYPNLDTSKDPICGEWLLKYGAGRPTPTWSDPNTKMANGNFKTWTPASLSFNHPGGQCFVGIEVRARYGLDLVEFWLKGFNLKLVEASTPPVATPAPTPTVVIMDDTTRAALTAARASLAAADKLLADQLARK